MTTKGVVAPPARRGRIPAWLWYAVPVVALSVAYLAIPQFGVDLTALGFGYAAVAAATAAAIVIGVRLNRPAARAAWLLIAAGQLAFAVGDVLFTVQYDYLLSETYPGVADCFYLASYPLTAAGLIVLVRRRTPAWHLPSFLDAAILATGAGLLLWIYVIAPLRAGAEVNGLAYTVVTVSYPFADLLLLTVATFLVLGAGIRPPAYYLLVGGLAVNMVTDVGYAVMNVLDLYHGGWIDGGWLLAYLLLGVAALHPSMRRLDERSPVAAPDSTMGRLAVLAVASLAAPAVLAIQYARGDDLHVPLIVATSALLFLLVLARMAMLVQVQRRQAITDALTGLHTRRFFEESLSVEAERVRRHGGGFGVLLFDLDFFKSVNDTYGHPGGDRVLCEVASRLRTAARTGDIVARYGGEEFGVLVSGIADANLGEIAERIRADIADVPIAVDGRTVISVTVSGGVAALSPGMTVDQVVLAADRALYAAKRAGRNRVVGARVPESVAA
jgi:diguanylate cyclase (GGDEF)-like protein